MINNYINFDKQLRNCTLNLTGEARSWYCCNNFQKCMIANFITIIFIKFNNTEEIWLHIKHQIHHLQQKWHLAKFRFEFYSSNRSVINMTCYTKMFISIVIRKIILLCYFSILDNRIVVDCVYVCAPWEEG